MYVGLHNHTAMGSNIRGFLDSTNRVDELIKYSHLLGHKGIAITDHDCISAHMQALDCIKDLKATDEKWKDYKLILGNEIYLCSRKDIQEDKDYRFYHFILLAKDAIGHRQIRELSTRAWTENSFTWVNIRTPTFYDDLFEVLDVDRGHLIAGTACLGGKLPNLILEAYKLNPDNPDYTKCRQWIKGINKHFGEGNFFLELQPSNQEDQIIVNNALVQFSEELGIPYIITSDAHYLKEEDRPIHEAFLKSNEDSGKEREVGEFYATTYVMSEKEIHSYMDSHLGYDAVQKGIDNTMLIYDMVEEYSLDQPLDIPYVPDDLTEPDYELSSKYFKDIPLLEWFFNSDYNADRHLVREIVNRIEKDSDELANKSTYDAIQTCLESIKSSSEANKSHWSAYLLQTRDLVNACWDCGSLVGPSRGCFIPDSMVLMGDGTQKPIQDVKAGDFVVTHLGNIRKVKNVFCYDVNEELTVIESENNKNIICTNNHKFWIENNWLEASNIKIGDKLSFPKISDLELKAYHSKCKAKNQLSYQGKVYDLNVEEDHSYVINNCAVHNSGLGFILLYILGITQVNPLKEDVETYHWRFLNPKRVSPLDIDVDFENIYRNDVIAYLQHKYCGDDTKAGQRRVTKVQTLSTMKAKNALQTACRGLGVSVEEAQFLSSFITGERGIQYTLKQVYYGDKENNLEPNTEFVNVINSKEIYKKVWEVALSIEGLVSGVGSHAGGVILTPKDIVNYCALMKTGSGDIITQFDLHTAEKSGLIKWDLLAIDALGKEHICLNLLKEDGLIENQGSMKATYEKYIGVYNIERNNPKIWEMINHHKIVSFFQMEKQSGYQAISIGKPESLVDLSALNSVMRLMAPSPGAETPLERYGRFKNDITLWYKEMAEYGLTEHEQQVVRKYAEKSYGLLPNQENFMIAVQDPEIGGFDLLWADKLRKSIAKKNPKAYMELQQEFYDNIKAKNLSSKLCHYVWDVLISMNRGLTKTSPHIPYPFINGVSF